MAKFSSLCGLVAVNSDSWCSGDSDKLSFAVGRTVGHRGKAGDSTMNDFDFFKARWQPLRPVFDGSLVKSGAVVGNIVRFVNGPIQAVSPPPTFVPKLDFSDKRDSQYIGPFGLP